MGSDGPSSSHTDHTPGSDGTSMAGSAGMSGSSPFPLLDYLWNKTGPVKVLLLSSRTVYTQAIVQSEVQIQAMKF